MGCDIHVHTEVKHNNEWHHYSAPHVDRWYDFFAHLAGVRNRDRVEPIAADRGLPDGISVVTKLEYKAEEPDAHSMSWCTKEEWCRAFKAACVGEPSFKDSFEFRLDPFPYDMEEYDSDECRVVFWFDN